MSSFSDTQRTPRQATWPSSVEPSECIDRFLEHYNKEHYYQVAKRASDLIEEELRKRPGGLRFNVTFRAKKEDSLEEKIRMRDAANNFQNRYQSEDEIWNDIHDLAGVRIILYTPSEDQRRTVESVIKAIWGAHVEIKPHDGLEDKTKSTTSTDSKASRDNKTKAATSANSKNLNEGRSKGKYRRLHPGYTAIHYRAKMKKSHERGKYSHKPRDRVEIQVVSALSHAWAEAGHDILYKSHAYGKPSAQEERLLDSLNGIVLSGDLLLEQFHELVVKRTVARFEHHYDFGIFLRELDILQPQEEGDENIEFDMEGLEVLLRFLVKIKKDFPIAVRDAFKDPRLGFPEEPKLDVYLKSNIKPLFQPAKGMLAIVCLLHLMLPPRDQDMIETVPPRKQCYIMINALLLLQTFFGRPELTNQFLQETIKMTEKQRESLHFVLTDTGRQLVLEEKPHSLGYDPYDSRVKGDMESAWDWFNDEANDEKSICGIAFRLAQMGATKDIEWTALLGRLTIGSILSRSPTSSEDDSE